MEKTFEIDPSLAKEAVLEGRTLLVEVSDTHHKVTLGPKRPPVTQHVGIKKAHEQLRRLLAGRTLFKTGREVTVFCETPEEAERLFDLLEELAGQL